MKKLWLKTDVLPRHKECICLVYGKSIGVNIAQWYNGKFYPSDEYFDTEEITHWMYIENPE